MWINRTLQPILEDKRGLKHFPVWLLIGPRQVGKSSLLKKCADQGRQFISLDDLQVRIRAKEDPILFARELKTPLCIDEIQYAPELLSALKILADASDTPGSIWLTGSQNFEVMQGVKESLAGRVAILNLFGLTSIEKNINTLDPHAVFSSIAESDFPKIFSEKNIDSRSLYISSYIQTYIERDVRELMGIQKRREFELFIKMCALRTGQLINYEDLARDSGVSPGIAKDWLSLLQDSFLIRILQPWYANKSKRLIKTPKLYFIDAGLCTHFMGWHGEEQIRLSPSAGACFETFVFSNIYRHLKHQMKTFEIHFWRTKDKEEIDFIVEVNGKIFPIEVKMGSVSAQSLPKLHASLGSSGYVVSLVASASPTAINSSWQLVSLNWMLEKLTS